MTLRGIIPPLVTPIDENGGLDLPAASRLLDHVLSGGVHGVFILGTTGEGPSLGYEKRRQFIEHATEHVAGRVPVVVGVSDTAYTESLALASHARKAGATAVAFTPPFYFVPGTPELAHYLELMADKLPMPFFFYNMPSLTKVSVPLEVAARVLEHPNCLGLKDSSADMFYFKKLRRLMSNASQSLLMGPEELLVESMLAGGHGGVNGGANLFPRLYVRIYELAAEGDFSGAAALQGEVMEISARLYTIGRHGSGIIKGIKGALEVRGICQRHMAEPFEGFTDSDLSQVREVLDALAQRTMLSEFC